MVQLLCKVWGFGLISILALTTSNILLSMHLIYTNKESNSQVPGTSDLCSSHSLQQHKFWTDGLSETNHSYYLEFLKKTSIVVGRASNDVISNSNKEEQIIIGQSRIFNDLHNGAGSIVSSNSYEDQKHNSELRTGGGGNSKYPNSAVNNEGDSFDNGLFSLDPRLGRFDNRRIFKTFDKIFIGPQYLSLVEKSPLCLATQTSVDRLYWIVQVSKYWEEAPISLAVFTPDVEYSIARAYMNYLVTCFPHLGQKVIVHFTFPRQFPPKNIYIKIDNLLDVCDQPVMVLKHLLSRRTKDMLKWRETMQYPQNLLRNVARKNCVTDWVFLTDVDIIPIPGMAQSLNTFLSTNTAKNCIKCAFVVPTYEVNEKQKLPFNRTVLVNLVAAGNARPFHQKVFVFNQHATNFSKWEAREKDFPHEKQVSISHHVTRFEFFYEPFYIARDNVPPHDERFIGYGFTRNTQVYEMYMAGYNFSVLTPVFTLHWGMQVKSSRPAWRERQNSLNRKLFEGFKRELYGRYQKDPLGMMKNRASYNKMRQKQ